jgi:chaperonin cofactor prefoldin
MEDRISELKDKTEIKEKTEELLVKHFRSCERYMQQLSNSIKKPNLRIMGIEKEEEGQAKGIHNIFNKIITKFPESRESYDLSGTGSLQDTKQT